MAEVHNLLCLEQKIRPKTTKLLNPSASAFLLHSLSLCSGAAEGICVWVSTQAGIWWGGHRQHVSRGPASQAYVIGCHAACSASPAGSAAGWDISTNIDVNSIIYSVCVLLLFLTVKLNVALNVKGVWDPYILTSCSSRSCFPPNINTNSKCH